VRTGHLKGYRSATKGIEESRGARGEEGKRRGRQEERKGRGL